MSQTDTVSRILDAAEILFAERGFTETSLRTITSTAGVNLAAVNYHFGSKKELIQAVFERFLTPFTQALAVELDRRVATGEPLTVEDLLSSIYQEAIGSLVKRGRDPQRFMRLLGLAYTQYQGHLRRFIVSRYGDSYRRFAGLLAQALPGLDPVTFYWRLYFMLGATIFTLSSFDAIEAILREDFGAESSLQETLERLVPAASAMLKVKG
ncbi:TetR family transcriptional regulator [Microbulbifer thermotolerans]|uniref:TetR/AcrR family transcriptional regulator n=1 Tax=Microbulbifer thermotolerans TaxID=252514 RepID=UPI00224AF0CF|nr:TetR/AcrR family transcriptional regulator [Microbulbifer thermotolerans]MCX2779793.1 TetR family transcriptional regulator [Microbulbifer thermotolerans]MCX2782275.1 TetR family transcriptional regulator [Microbulbifer thermotolerans]MCX2805036.1 TetR family transcriptional regulator [Microbulbifer thermotolerans]MCX2833536.1 TetR family transcriptional regulator [Microbulbifer thermotolerans]MCX2840219.1 TetR family transcriptional regulator [Microbulbifer thermotolerans]